MHERDFDAVHVDGAALVACGDAPGADPLRYQPRADLVDRHDLRSRSSGDLERVMDVVEVTVSDEHQVTALNRFQLFGRNWVVHDPGIDEDLLAPGASDLPGAVPNPGEADVSVERHRDPPDDQIPREAA